MKIDIIINQFGDDQMAQPQWLSKKILAKVITNFIEWHRNFSSNAGTTNMDYIIERTR